MPKAKCFRTITFGATGEHYQAGNEYNIKEEILKSYPDCFERLEGSKDEDVEEDKTEATEENK